MPRKRTITNISGLSRDPFAITHAEKLEVVLITSRILRGYLFATFPPSTVVSNEDGVCVLEKNKLFSKTTRKIFAKRNFRRVGRCRMGNLNTRLSYIVLGKLHACTDAHVCAELINFASNRVTSAGILEKYFVHRRRYQSLRFRQRRWIFCLHVLSKGVT